MTRSPARWHGVVVVLILLAIAAHAAPSFHQHADAGLFSDECPLARLAAGHVCTPSVESPEATSALTARGIAFVPVTVDPLLRSSQPFAPRAPPVSA